MKKQKRLLLITVLLLTAVISLTSCATYDAFYSEFIDRTEETYETVKIGVFEPLSGKDKAAGELEKIGIELAHELKPECMGKKVELIYEDNESDIYVAEARIQELIAKEPGIILGSYGSVYSLIAGDYIKEAKIPAIAITNTNPLVTSNNPYYFRVSFVDSYQCIALAKYVHEAVGVSEAAILRPAHDDFASARTSAFEKKFVQETGNKSAVVKILEYEHGDTAFNKQLKNIKELGVKAVMLPGVTETEAVTIITEAKKMGIDAVFMVSEELGSSETFTDALGDAEEMAVYAMMYDSKTALNKTGKIFEQAYHKKYGKDKVPEPAVALGFDAYMVAIDALDRTGTVRDGELLKDNLAKTVHYPGASGNITLDSNGDPMKSVVIKGIVDGKLKNIYVMEPAIVQIGQ